MKITLLKAPTGLGKTEVYIELVKPGDLIVTPFHDLNKEIAARLKALNKDCILSTERHQLAEEETNNIYKQLLKVGNIKAANAFYAHTVEEYANLTLKNEKQEACESWINEQKILKTTNKIVVATHAKLQALNSVDFNNVFIDEDIIDTCLISQATASISDLEKVVELLEWEQDLGEKNYEMLYKIVKAYVKKIKKSIKNKVNVIYTSIVLTECQKKLLSDVIKNSATKFSTQVYSFFDNNYFIDNAEFDEENWEKSEKIKIVPQYYKNGLCKNVTIVKLNKEIFKENTNYIIMSATLSEKIWKKVFPNAEFKEIKLEENEQMLLYFQESCSRSKLKNNEDYISYIKNVISTDMPVITFKNFKSELKNSGFTNVQTEMHLGKTAGADSLKGQDIAVVGTPHLNAHAYICVAAALNIDCSEISMSYQKIERNDFDFWFYTYNNPDLQEIQLHKIETELIQAAGRARSNRTDAKVYIFSNLPIPGVKLMC